MSSIDYISSVLWIPLFELPIENNKHLNFDWRGGGRGVDFFCFSEAALFEYNVSTILSPIVDFMDSNGSFQTWKIWGVSLLDLALLSPSSKWETDSSKPFFIWDLAKSSYNWTWKTKKNTAVEVKEYRTHFKFSNKRCFFEFSERLSSMFRAKISVLYSWIGIMMLFINIH